MASHERTTASPRDWHIHLCMLTLCGATSGYTDAVLAALSWANSDWVSPQHSLRDILSTVAALVDEEQAQYCSAHVTLWHMVYHGIEEIRTYSQCNEEQVMCYREHQRLEQLRDDLWTEEDREQLRQLALGILRRDLHHWYCRSSLALGPFAAIGAMRELMVYGIAPIENASEAAAEGWNYLENAVAHVPDAPIRNVVQDSMARCACELRAQWEASRV